MASSRKDPVLERTYKGHRDVVNSVHFSPSTNQLASGGLDSNLMVWHLHDNMRAFRFSGHQRAINWVRFSPTGHLIASASMDSTVRLWIPTIKGDSLTVKAHTAAVRCVEFTSDESQFLTTSDDKTIKLWDTKQRKFIRSFAQHNNWVRCASFDLNDGVIVSGGDDRTVKVWDKNSGQCVKSIEHLPAGVLSVAFQPSGGDCMAASLANGSVRLWDLRNYKMLQLYESSGNAVHGMSFHPNGHFILTASEDSSLRILDLLEGRVGYTIKGHQGAAKCVSFSSNGDYFASAGQDEQVYLWKTSFIPHSFKNISQKLGKSVASSTVQSSSQVPKGISHVGSGFSSSKTRNVAKQINFDQEKENKSGEANCVSTSDESPSFSRKEIPAPVSYSPSAPSMNIKVSLKNQSGTEVRLKSTESSVQELTAQVDILVQTVSLLEQRLSFMEDKFDQLISMKSQIRKLHESSAEGSPY